jgi:hypothetical protein
MDSINFKIKDSVVRGDKSYLLLAMYEDELLPEIGVPNVIATDRKGNLLWAVEPPTTKYDIYAKIYFKGDNFFAVSSAGQVHQIDEATGKVISSKMIK